MEDEVVFGTSGTKNWLVPKNKHRNVFLLFSGKLPRFSNYDLDGMGGEQISQTYCASWWFQICFYFHPRLGKIPNLTNTSIFQRG